MAEVSEKLGDVDLNQIIGHVIASFFNDGGASQDDVKSPWRRRRLTDKKEQIGLLPFASFPFQMHDPTALSPPVGAIGDAVVISDRSGEWYALRIT